MKSPLAYVGGKSQLSKTIEDFVTLADTLKTMRGKWILSLNDLPQIREIFRDFEIKPVELRYSISKTKNTVGKEVLISNFHLG